MEYFNGNLEITFECPSCNEMFSTEKYLEENIEIVHEQISSLFLISHASSDSWLHVSCNSCETKLQNDADKRLHEINDHGYQECQFCGVLYCSARELEDHLKSHHEQIEPSINISCDICEMILKTEADMKFHQSRVHD